MTAKASSPLVSTLGRSAHWLKHRVPVVDSENRDSPLGGKSSKRIRFDAIHRYLPDAPDSILDVGCVRHNATRRASGNLHAELDDQYPMADLFGIDIIEEEIESMTNSGYEVNCVDCQDMALDRTFESIVAGEVIEHLSAPGEFFKRAEEHLSPGGTLIITTPNPDAFAYWRKAITGQSNNETHTAWIDPFNLERVLEIVDTDLTVEEWEYLPPTGGISGLLWRSGYKRASGPTYITKLTQ